MAKQPRVWDGSQWQELAVTLPDLSNYSTTTQMNTAIDNAKGLVYITGSTFTTASAVSFNNVFSSTYRNYKVIFNVKGSTGNTLQSRMRLNGTDNTTASSYGSQYISARATTVSGAKVTLDNFRTAYLSATTNSIQVMEIGNPNVAEATSFQVFNTYFGSSFAVTDTNIWFGYHNQSTAYDGITFSVDTGTFTGTLEIYGYEI